MMMMISNLKKIECVKSTWSKNALLFIKHDISKKNLKNYPVSLS